MNTFRISVGDVVFAVTGAEKIQDLTASRDYPFFLLPPGSRKKPSVSIRHFFDTLPLDYPLPENRKIFDSGMVWRMYDLGSRYLLAFFAPMIEPKNKPYKLAFCDRDFTRIEVHNRLSSPNPRHWRTERFLLPCPLQTPLSEITLVTHLARHRLGMMFHSCGLIDGKRGYLFCGQSTNGKSTMGRIWDGSGIRLNDDRNIVRRYGRNYYMFGSPWHGKYDRIVPATRAIDRLFVLRHGKTNRVRLLPQPKAFSLLMARCFPPVWFKEDMHFCMEFAYELTRDIPCYELFFVPDKKVIPFIRNLPIP